MAYTVCCLMQLSSVMARYVFRRKKAEVLYRDFPYKKASGSQTKTPRGWFTRKIKIVLMKQPNCGGNYNIQTVKNNTKCPSCMHMACGPQVWEDLQKKCCKRPLSPTSFLLLNHYHLRACVSTGTLLPTGLRTLQHMLVLE